MVNQHRDTYTSIMGHPNLLDSVAIVENQSRERTRFTLLQVSLFVRRLQIAVATHRLLVL